MKHEVEEEWRPVVGYEGSYSVSNHGNVKSHDRRVPHWRGGTRFQRGARLKPHQQSTGGYLVVSLCDGQRVQNYAVHVIVAEAFIGARPTPSHEVAHEDGDSTNNRAGNLSYKTPKENAADRDRHGRTCRGERGGTAVLTEAEVFAIRASTETQRATAARYGISQAQVSDIKLNKAWRHLA